MELKNTMLNFDADKTLKEYNNKSYNTLIAWFTSKSNVFFTKATEARGVSTLKVCHGRYN